MSRKAAQDRRDRQRGGDHSGKEADSLRRCLATGVSLPKWELVRFVAATLGVKRHIVALPGALGTLQAVVLERLPGKLMTRDNLRSMQVDNVCAGPFPALFGFRPSAMEAVVPHYMAPSSARSRYPRYRNHAGR